MKKTRLFLSVALLSIAGLTTTTMTSCNKEDEVCETGFEGSKCDVEIREKFIGSYTASDTEVGGDALPTYTATISKGTNITEVKIGKISDGYFKNDVIAATISGNAITINSQQPDADGYSISGSGTISGNNLSISYTITELSSSKEIRYTGSWTK